MFSVSSKLFGKFSELLYSNLGCLQCRASFCTIRKVENKLDEHRNSKAVPLIRIVPRNDAEAKTLMDVPHEVPNVENQRALKVAIVGAPNVGKSTLTNRLMGFRVCSISDKVHTTTRNTTAVFLENNVQMILLDTPGLVNAKESKRHHLNKSMEEDPKVALANADVVVVMVDASNRWTRLRLDYTLLTLLRKHQKDSVLVINKVDLVKKKRTLLEMTDALTCGVVDGFRAARRPSREKTGPSIDVLLKETMKITENKVNATVPHVAIASRTSKDSNVDVAKSDDEKPGRNGYPHFKRVFMISALDGGGIADLKARILTYFAIVLWTLYAYWILLLLLKGYLTSTARCRGWSCPPALVTDQSPQEIGMMAVREKLLNALPQEIPYHAQVKVEMWEVDPSGKLRAVVSVTLPKKHQLRLLLGPGGRTIRDIADRAREDLTDTFRCDVSLKIVANCAD